jgi:tripeptidyl-peptidase-1
MHVSILPVAALAAGSWAFPTLGFGAEKRSFTATSTFESISAPPSRWAKHDVAGFSKDEATLELRIQLAHQNMDKFHDLALNVCKPPLSELYVASDQSTRYITVHRGGHGTSVRKHTD